MTYRKILTLLLIGIFISSCEWNLNAPDGGNGGTDPDTTAFYKNVTSENLPDGSDATSPQAKAGDIDNDGDLDLIIAVSFSPNRILINNGAGKFTDESSIRLPQKNFDSQDVAINDFNSDGNLDLFFVGNQNQTNELYINNGNGVFSDLGNRIPVSGNSTAAEAVDINGDGPVDILIGNLGQNILLINNGNAFFSNQSAGRLPQNINFTRDLAMADLTGDNLRDIVVGNENTNSLLINYGSGFFTDQTSSRLPLPGDIEETEDVNIADMDGDNDQDLYFGNTGFQEGSNPQDRLLINNGQGFFTDATSDRLPAITTFTFDADFADLDNDGDMDLVVGNYNGGIRVLINNGSGYFSDYTALWMPNNFSPLVLDLEIADFNNDDWLDIFVAVENGPNQLLLKRNSN